MSYEEIADFRIKEVQEKSTGFQLVVSFKKIGLKFKNNFGHRTFIGPLMSQVIKEELETREEVAKVDIVDGGFDVVLYTDYAPNYTDNLEFDIDICEKCGKFMPEGRILCKECV